METLARETHERGLELVSHKADLLTATETASSVRSSPTPP
jgi:hypothetical protein